MSSDLDLTELYRLFGNPLEKQFADMRNSLARSRTQKPDSDTKLDTGSVGPHSRNFVKFVNEHYNIKLHDLGTSEYYPAYEPDYEFCKLIIMTDHYGYKMFDDAQMSSSINGNPFGQDITMHGDPRLESGFDRGYGDATNTKKRQALHFNRSTSPTYLQDYLTVRDQGIEDPNKSMRVTDASSGFSFFSRVKFDSLALNGNDGNSIDSTLVNKADDFNGDNKYVVSVDSDGKIRFGVSKANVDKNRKTTSQLVANTDYEIWTVYDPAGGTDDLKLKIYVNGSIQTNEATTFPSMDTGNFDMYLGRRGQFDGGYISGYLIYTKFFLNYKVSASEVSQHWTNKLTIANIAAGKVATTETSVPRDI